MNDEAMTNNAIAYLQSKLGEVDAEIHRLRESEDKYGPHDAVAGRIASLKERRRPYQDQLDRINTLLARREMLKPPEPIILPAEQ